MFQSLIHTIIDDNYYLYQVIDDDFSSDPIEVQGREVNTISTRVNIIITEYQRRNLPVATNVARFYRWWSKTCPRAEEQRNPNFLARINEPYVRSLHPELQYTAKYYPCVVNQLKQLTWGKKL